jgi:hypothetical protein
MAPSARFRYTVPVVQCCLAGMLGVFGLRERAAILSRPFLKGVTVGETTASFHIWRWPFKFAVTMNVPGFVCGGLIPLVSAIGVRLSGAVGSDAELNVRW